MKNLEKEIVYPISLNYREHWKEWEAIRELVQNALDSSNTYKSYFENGNFVIEDYGKGLEVKHLLFGVSEKEDKNLARGKFGEGLKIALLVLKRLGYDVEILSNNLEIKVSTAYIADQECLKLLYKNNRKSFNGTRVIIKNYSGLDYKDRFITPDGNFDILFNDVVSGSLIKTKANEVSKLYVKDIYVCDLPNAEFSYNLKNVMLEESRNVADQWSLNREIGTLWKQIDSVELWIKFFEAVKNKKYEAKAVLRYCVDKKVEEAIKEAFDVVYPNHVLFTNEFWANEAIWRGKQICREFDTYDQELLFNVLETDKQFVLKQQSASDVEVEEKTLNDIEKENLAIARKLAETIDKQQDVKVYMMENADGKAGNPIKVSRNVLSSLERTISVMIHELTHTYYNTNDMTTEMIHRLSDLAAKLLAQYVKSEFETSLLECKVGKYTQYKISIPKEKVVDQEISKGDRVIVTIRKFKGV